MKVIHHCLRCERLDSLELFFSNYGSLKLYLFSLRGGNGIGGGGRLKRKELPWGPFKSWLDLFKHVIFSLRNFIKAWSEYFFLKKLKLIFRSTRFTSREKFIQFLGSKIRSRGQYYKILQSPYLSRFGISKPADRIGSNTKYKRYENTSIKIDSTNGPKVTFWSFCVILFWGFSRRECHWTKISPS